MATGLSAAAANAAVDDLTGTYSWVKLHTGDPGAAGTSNAAGNTTRQQATFSAASGGATANTAAVEWTSVGTAEDYTHFSVWTASSAGSFGWSGTITANAVQVGDTFRIPTGDLDLSVAVAS